MSVCLTHNHELHLVSIVCNNTDWGQISCCQYPGLLISFDNFKFLQHLVFMSDPSIGHYGKISCV